MRPTTQLLHGDCIQVLRGLPGGCVHCCVTSPPYWGLRDYGVAGQIGLEPTPEAYVARMVELFAEVRRVLRDDGTLWLNIGDSYCTHPHGPRNANTSDPKWRNGRSRNGDKPNRTLIEGIKHKDLVGIPWALAFALRADGWHLRSEIIWWKPNAMVESVRDRPTRCHEQVFLLSKKPRYFYDAVAVMEPISPKTLTVNTTPRKGDGRESTGEKVNGWMEANGGRYHPEKRNRRTVWRIPTRSYKGAHFATFPPRLVEPCIKAGTSEHGCCPKCGAPWLRQTKKERVATRPGLDTKISGRNGGYNGVSGEHSSDGRAQFRSSDEVGNRDPKRHMTRVVTTGWKPGCECGEEPIPCTVLDPFAGSGTTLATALNLGRSGIGIELNQEYIGLAEARIQEVLQKTALYA